MPALANHKHELFAQALAKGENATNAYKGAGYTALGNSAEAAASRLLSDVKVQTRVSELQARAAIKVEKTVADLVLMLEEDRVLARSEGQPSAAVSAVMGMGKLLGHLKDKVEHSGPNGTPIEYRTVAQAEIDEMFGPPRLVVNNA
jgi:hypothetical protein